MCRKDIKSISLEIRKYSKGRNKKIDKHNFTHRKILQKLLWNLAKYCMSGKTQLRNDKSMKEQNMISFSSILNSKKKKAWIYHAPTTHI